MAANAGKARIFGGGIYSRKSKRSSSRGGRK